MIVLLTIGVRIARRWPAVKRLTDMGGDGVRALAPRLFALTTFAAGTILLVSGATPARAGRLGWLNDVLPLPLVEASSYSASIAGVGLIILARGLQRRLDAAYHLTVWVLAGGIIFSLASALDVEQAISLAVMLVILIPSKRFFYRKSSIFEERFTRGWIAAIAIVLFGTVAIATAQFGSGNLGAGVFWRFGYDAQGPRAQRALILAAIALTAFAVARLLRPARVHPHLANADELAAAGPIVADSLRAAAQLAFLGDKSIMFNEAKTAFIMFGVAGQSWVALGDPVGPVRDSVALIEEFITRCDRSGGWPVFYRVSPPLLHLYLDYALAVVKLGEIARVSLANFSLDGPQRRNLRRVWRKAVDDGCTFEMVNPEDVPALLPRLKEVSDEWLREKRTREKRFSLGQFDEAFIRRSAVAVVKREGQVVAFVTVWCAGQRAEVEVDLMRYTSAAPSGIMRYALIEAMFWASKEGYAWFNLGAAPLAGIRTSSISPLWNQLTTAVRGVGERYYNFEGLRNFKDWFYPEWEGTYLVSPGGTKRPAILANIASLISGSIGGAFRK
ncbi:MAG: phosphatidylglycerol lysyltransferase domain-containing protein [Gemmatimonadaceae bacterium]